jgi:hypothetical protein
MADVEPENGLARHASTVEEQDEAGLAEFGYKQELRRDWGMMHNFGISFSIIVGHLLFTSHVTRPLLTRFAVCYYGYYHTFRIWAGYWWPWGDVCWLDCGFGLYNVRCSWHG